MTNTDRLWILFGIFSASMTVMNEGFLASLGILAMCVLFYLSVLQSGDKQ